MNPMSRKKTVNPFLKITLFSLIIFLLYFFVANNFNNEENIRLTFFDVGQGDSCYLNIKNKKSILIDGGPDNLVLREIGREMNYFMPRINFVIVSHFHHDHILGLIEIFKRYKVDYLIYGKGLKHFQPSELLFIEAEKQKTKILEVEKEIIINLESDCDLKIFNPASLLDDKSVDDNASLLSKLDCHGFTFLAAGDNEHKLEAEILNYGFDLSAKIFKASHHGSKTSNSIEFIEAINPELIVISVGENNTFNHPSLEVIKRVENKGIELKRTDQVGVIKIFTNLK